MTNSQYIEVAEKVWGLDSYQLDREYQNHQWYGHDSFPFEDFIKATVNSWQGFGRTLERFAGDMKYTSKFWALIKPIIAQYLINQAKDSTEQLFEQIHLAALEAIVNDTSKA